jgi:hypothetical protein
VVNDSPRAEAATRRLPLWARYLPIAMLLGALLLRVLAQDWYDRLTAEDGPVEWMTFAVYLTAAVIAVFVAWRFRRQGLLPAAVLFVLVTVALLGIAGEEISWGQRQVGFTGPEIILEHNKQDEANLHNLLRRPMLHMVYIVVGLYGAGLGRLMIQRISRLRKWSWMLAPGPSTMWYFACCALAYVYFEVSELVLEPAFGSDISPLSLGISRIQEVAELGLSLGFLLFVRAVYAEASRGKSLVTGHGDLQNDSPRVPPPRHAAHDHTGAGISVLRLERRSLQERKAPRRT